MTRTRARKLRDELARREEAKKFGEAFDEELRNQSFFLVCLGVLAILTLGGLVLAICLN